MQPLILGTNCRLFKMGRNYPWDELSLFVIWDELPLGTNRRLGRIVAWDELLLYVLIHFDFSIEFPGVQLAQFEQPSGKKALCETKRFLSFT